VNRLILGDSDRVLPEIESGTIDLIYMDPPFFSNRIHESNSIKSNCITFDDMWNNDMNVYLDFISNVIVQAYRVLKPTGLLFLHCDWHAVHYLKVELDKIFGYKNFKNEIIWKRHNSQNNAKQGTKLFGRIHDSILTYSKSEKHTWNQIYMEYSKEYVEKAYRYVDKKTGDRYALGDLTGPGGASKGNPFFEFCGHKRYWRYNQTKMQKLLKEGKIVQTGKKSVPTLKRYLKDMKGVPLNDIWLDISTDQVKNKKDIVYPTQKPLELLDRIISCASNKGDIVLDPFCGSGTSLISSHNLGRRWIGIDKNEQAIKTVMKRIEEQEITNLKLEKLLPEIKTSVKSHYKS
jgi:DNA modification methylase